MMITISRSKKGITAYCHMCRKKWRTNNSDYAAAEQDILKFERKHGHKSAAVLAAEAEERALVSDTLSVMAAGDYAGADQILGDIEARLLALRAARRKKVAKRA